MRHDDKSYRKKMKINIEQFDCLSCSYRNGNVCNICYKKLFNDFNKERKVDINAEAGKDKGINRKSEKD